MPYTATTDSTHSKWIITGTGTTRNRLHDLMIHDCADGPYYDVASAWTQSAGDGAEYYHAPTKRPDNVYVSGTKLTEQADDTCIDGGGAGLANGQWCWMTANSRVYVQVAAGSPGANADFYYDWNGGNSGTDFMTQTVEDGIYQISLMFQIGNGTTTTTLSSIREVVWFVGTYFQVRQQATLNIGAITGDWGYQSSYWSIAPSADANVLWYGTLNIYASTLMNRANKNMFFYGGTLLLNKARIEGGYAIDSGSGRSIDFKSGTINIVDSDVADLVNATFSVTPTTVNGYHAHACNNGITVGSTATPPITVSGANYTSIITDHIRNTAAGLYLVNPETSPTNITQWDGDIIYLQYTVAFRVVDKDGVAIENATVTWLDSQSTTGNDITDVNGDASFTLTAKQWSDAAETLTNFNTFTFTISKAGYETLIMENVTLSAAVSWRVELQDPAAGGLLLEVTRSEFVKTMGTKLALRI